MIKPYSDAIYAIFYMYDVRSRLLKGLDLYVNILTV